METTLEALEEVYSHPIYSPAALRAALRWARVCELITSAEAMTLIKIGQAKWETPTQPKEKESPLTINQAVEFIGWRDNENHKDGPTPGMIGIVLDIYSNLPEELFPTMHEVSYHCETGRTRTIHHFREEIRPFESQEKTP